MKKSQSEILKNFQHIHGNRYDYSKVIYKGSFTKIIIIWHCLDKNGKEHGEFIQTPSSHLCGAGCPICARKIKRTHSNENFIKIATKIHNGFYSYSKTNYTNGSDKIIITCPIHGDFIKTAKEHINCRKSGCPKCSSEKRTKTQEQFIKEANKVHKNFYSYDKTKYTKDKEKVIITCPKHKDFQQTANNHINGHGCPRCQKSKGEEKIENWLSEQNIKFIPQKMFDGCKGKRRRLPFDFYLPDYNTCIEYDGRQHFQPVNFGNKNNHSKKDIQILFDTTLKNDEIKNNFCKNNNINLLRIPYFSLETFFASKNFCDFHKISEKQKF